MKSFIKRSMSGLLAFLMCFTVLLGAGTTTALAASEQSASVMIAFPRDGDANQDYGQDTWGHPALQLMNGWHADFNDRWIVHAQGSFEGQVCYCIEPGVERSIDDWYTSYGETSGIITRPRITAPLSRIRSSSCLDGSCSTAIRGTSRLDGDLRRTWTSSPITWRRRSSSGRLLSASVMNSLITSIQAERIL